MNDIDLADLRAKAENVAVPYEWAIWHDLDHQGFKTVGDAETYREVMRTGEADDVMPVAHVYTDQDAAFIAAADPPTMLALLDQLAERDATIAAALEHASQTHPDYDNAAATYQVLAASDGSALAERDRATAERAWNHCLTDQARSRNPYAKEQAP